MSKAFLRDPNELPVYSWDCVRSIMPAGLTRGLFMPKGRCAMCDRFGYVVLAAMASGVGRTAGIAAFCVPCLRLIPTPEASDNRGGNVRLTDRRPVRSYDWSIRDTGDQGERTET